MSERTVTIGGAAGAWGDSSLSTPQLLASGRCDYIIWEGLAEITMGILTRAKMANPDRGYATDIIRQIAANVGEFAEQGIKVVTNAGGINTESAAAVIREAIVEAGLDLKVATVSGDDLMQRLDEVRAAASPEMADGAEFPAFPISCNAYLGARPIAAALDTGADIVVTGRVVDSALVLGPLVHEFGWAWDDWDRLSQGSLAGHLIECGPQATGGLFTDWESFDSWANIGYPLAECREDGSFVITKPDGTDGLATVATVAEQLLYEIGDPANYLLPDVTCDWRDVRLEQIGEDRIEVTGAVGRPAPPTLKACAQTLDGFKLMLALFIGGRNAVGKAERLAADGLARSQRVLDRDGFAGLRDVSVEVIGAEATYGPHSRARDAREVMLKISLHHDEERALKAVLRELPSFGLAVPGVSGGGSGLPRPTPLVRLRSHLVPKLLVPAVVEVDGEAVAVPDAPDHDPVDPPSVDTVEAARAVEPTVTVPLIAIAHGRSGDKGNDANIGIRARHPDFLPLLREVLTADVVKEHMAHAVKGAVERHDLPGIDAMNFHLHDALGGGGIASLRMDPQGKAFAQQLLDREIAIPSAWLEHVAIAGVPEVEALRRG
ncbi:MAG: acyclic terpene utilization AtuA family protein [Nitriliruptorales bacterium]|nr:acyclic terpene utilization AtuA family protein [Nitriliruptorales bacterium]